VKQIDSDCVLNAIAKVRQPLADDCVKKEAEKSVEKGGNGAERLDSGGLRIISMDSYS
jgi:hypothetical protein